MLQINQRAPDVLDIRIDGDIFGGWEYDPETESIVVSRTSSEYVAQEISKYPEISQINLYINSWGGEVKEAYGIMSQLKRTGAKITAYNDGFACSAAANMLVSADEIIMPKNAIVMIHNMATLAYGNSAELRKTADALDKMMEGCRTIYLDRAKNGMTEAELTAMLDNETWLTAQECYDIGWCDQLIDNIDMHSAGEAVKNSAVKQARNPEAQAVVNKINALREEPNEPENPKSWLDNLKKMRGVQ